MGNIETATKFSRLKSVSSTEDNYIDAAPVVFYTKAVLKNYALFTAVKKRLYRKTTVGASFW